MVEDDGDWMVLFASFANVFICLLQSTNGEQTSLAHFSCADSLPPHPAAATASNAVTVASGASLNSEVIAGELTPVREEASRRPEGPFRREAQARGLWARGLAPPVEAGFRKRDRILLPSELVRRNDALAAESNSERREATAAVPDRADRRARSLRQDVYVPPKPASGIRILVAHDPSSHVHSPALGA